MSSICSLPRSVVVATLAVVALSGCAPLDEPGLPADYLERLPVVQVLEGSFVDGELTFRTLEGDELVQRGLLADEAPDSDVAVTVEELQGLESRTCSGAACIGTEYVALSSVTGGMRAITHSTAVSGYPLWAAGDVTNCGPVPGIGFAGVCQNIRLRNLFGRQLERVYVEIAALNAVGTTSSVSMNTPQPFAGAAGFGVAESVTSGLFRFGEMGRSSPTAGGQSMWWGFRGARLGSGVLTFSFLVRVHGLIVPPTQRASLATGLLDDPSAGYPSRATTTIASSNLALSDDGRYAAFASTTAIFRKDLWSGTLATVASGCTTASNPHLSADGGVVVFQASGCDLSGVGSTTASPQIYAYSFASGVTQLVSRTSAGGYGGSTSSAPRVSADGQVVVFQSAAVNLMSGTPASTVRPGCVEVYRFNRATLAMSHASAIRLSSVSVPTAGWDAGCTGSSTAGVAPDVSGSGNLVVFHGFRPLDAVADVDTRSDVYVYDHAATVTAGTAVVYRVSVRDTGAAFTAGASSGASVSDDGTVVVFGTDATNVVTGTTTAASRRHIYRRSSASAGHASIVRVDRRVDGAEPSQSAVGIPEVSSTGRFVAFWSAATDTASSGTFTPAGSQVYVCDLGASAPLNRCWLASAMQPSSTGSFASLVGAVQSSMRIALAYPTDAGAGYVAYLALPTAGTWGSAGGAGTQVFVSPVGDPRYQQVTVIP